MPFYVPGSLLTSTQHPQELGTSVTPRAKGLAETQWLKRPLISLSGSLRCCARMACPAGPSHPVIQGVFL